MAAPIAPGAPVVAGPAVGSLPLAGPLGATLNVTGHGYGHGVGLSQYGALGYAADQGWSAEQILDHYYGGTVGGPIPGDPAPNIRVQLAAAAGAQTAVVGNALVTTADGSTGTWTSVVVRPAANGAYDVWGRTDAQQCPGSSDDLAAPDGQGIVRWTLVASAVVGPVDIGAPAGTPLAAPADLAALCEPGGTVRAYRGLLRAVRDANGKAQTVNEVSLESYLRGVVPSEMPAGWATLGGGRGIEALKAQAVAARSYARAERRYTFADTCDTQSCQVYGGAARRAALDKPFVAVEQPATDSAIAATAGVVRLRPGGTVVSTMFSASSGGYTAPSTSPGFPAVPDVGDDTRATRNPYHDWSASVPTATIEARWPAIGTLSAVTVTKTNGLGAEGGRVLKMEVIGTRGKVTVTGDEFRLAAGLRSNWFTVGGGDRCAGRGEPVVDTSWTPSTAANDLLPVSPVRVIDTRNALGTTAVPLGAGCTLTVDLGQRPTGATAVAVVVTTTRSSDNGYTTAYPCATARPETSAVQVLKGSDAAGTTVVPLGADGQVCLYTSVTTDVLVDVLGWLVPGAGPSYLGLPKPVRLLDTRAPGAAPLGAGSETRVVVPASAGAVADGASINVTATGSAAAGYVSAYPCDRPSTDSSVVNFRVAADSANHVFVDLDPGGALCLWNSAPVHLVVDLDGAFGAAPGAQGIRVQTPSRLVDSRNQLGTSGPLVPGVERILDTGAPSAGILAQVTIVDPRASGFVALYPCGDAGGGTETSVANAAKGTNVANTVLLRTDAGGRWCARSSMPTDLLIDIVGRV